MDPAPAPLTGAVASETMPAELLAAFVEVMLESSRGSSLRDDADSLTR